jgi:hypothetical protein
MFIKKIKDKYEIVDSSKSPLKSSAIAVHANTDFAKLEKFLSAADVDYSKFIAGIKKDHLEADLMTFIKEAHVVRQEEQLDLFEALKPQLKKLLKMEYMMSPIGVDPRIHQWFHTIWPGKSPY